LKERYKKREKGGKEEEEDVSSYWMTLRKREDRESIRSHWLENLLSNRL
jgi:hypothetical protein